MTFNGTSGHPPAALPTCRSPQSPLGLGPLEAAIMTVLWDATGPVTLTHVHKTLDYPWPVTYNTVATVAANLCVKGLATRHIGDGTGQPGMPPWQYRPAQPRAEHIGHLIATLLDQCPPAHRHPRPCPGHHPSQRGCPPASHPHTHNPQRPSLHSQ